MHPVFGRVVIEGEQLRTGETRLLRPEHVHLRDRNLEVMSSKGNRSRRLPLTVEVTEVLTGCDRVSRVRFGSSRGTFFVSSTGNEVTVATVCQIFQRIWDQADLPRPTGGQQPRPYDLRHHFAYANVERWMTQGKDVMAMLPFLARYMGHGSIESTFYYINTSPEFLHTYEHLTAVSQSLLPEVGFDET